MTASTCAANLALPVAAMRRLAFIDEVGILLCCQSAAGLPVPWTNRTQNLASTSRQAQLMNSGYVDQTVVL
jgi:hypothetical protein